MKINIKATNLELSDSLRSYLEEKLDYINKLINPQDESVIADVELAKITMHHRHGEIFKAEVNLHTAKHDHFAEAEEADLYVAIDMVKDEIAREIKSAQAKELTLLRRGGRKLKAMLCRISPWR